MTQLTYDLLLEYLSALRQGSWETFKMAARVVSENGSAEEDSKWLPSATSIATYLSALGHVEFAFDDTLQWQAAPATIITSSALGPGYGVLCGARDSRVVEAVRTAAHAKGAQVHFASQHHAPSVISIHCASDQNLAAIAADAGVHFESDLASRLLRCAPALASLRQAAPEQSLPHGYAIERFDAVRLEWVPVECVAGDGSYYFACYRPEHRIVREGRAIKVSRSVAVYYALAVAGKSVVEYGADKQELVIPRQAYPPALFARALVLHSGHLPTHERGHLRFASIPLHAALTVKQGLERE